MPPDTTSNPGTSWRHDKLQEDIVTAPHDARLIVNAPPGTGKTAVACRRIAHLLEKGVPPHQIWLISFTRTAVLELRNRIAIQAEKRKDVYGVKVSTLDSRAWQFVQGFEGRGGQALKKGHARTIADAINIVRKGGEQVDEAFSEIAHLIVDEAQDLVGDRGDLVLEIIKRIPRSSSVLVFTDDAQSIYGFAEDELDDPADASTLPELLRSDKQKPFREETLRTVYRTNSPQLKRLFIDVREEMLKKLNKDPGRAFEYIVDEVEAAKVGEAIRPREAVYEDGRLVLYRSRYEVLDESCYLADKGRSHRLRMSGLPTCLSPWIGSVFSRTDKARLSRSDFEKSWMNLSQSLAATAPSIEQAWDDLMRHAGEKSQLNLNDLREVLARPRPPLEFVVPDLGHSGPILSTIHASKGREATNVCLMLPEEFSDRQDDAEETRVLFVGATRARASLEVGEAGGRRSAGRKVDGRVCVYTSGQKRARVEIGREHDYQAHSIVAKSVQKDGTAESVQDWLSSNGHLVHAVTAYRNNDDGFRYWLRLGRQNENGILLGRYEESLNLSLFKVAREMWPQSKLKPPPWIGPLFSHGLRTVVLAPEDERLSDVHKPFATSGFWLAPIVLGLPTVPFFNRSR